MRLLVGCPIAHREWILPTWFAHVERACVEVPVRPEYVFVVSRDDKATLDCINGFVKEADEKRLVSLAHTDIQREEDVRVWNPGRYAQMVTLRNTLLEAVRSRQPDYFLSLDSDILLAPEALNVALNEIGNADALGMCTYMTPAMSPPMGESVHWGIERSVASKAKVVNGRLTERIHYPTHTATHAVDAIMAAKLMKPTAYAVDYVSHPQGEDIGWSLSCWEKGLKLVWCPQAQAKHVMRPDLLDKVDYRVGF